MLPEQADVPVKANRKDITVLKDGRMRVNRDEFKALKELEDK